MFIPLGIFNSKIGFLHHSTLLATTQRSAIQIWNFPFFQTFFFVFFALIKTVRNIAVAQECTIYAILIWLHRTFKMHVPSTSWSLFCSSSTSINMVIVAHCTNDILTFAFVTVIHIERNQLLYSFSTLANIHSSFKLETIIITRWTWTLYLLPLWIELVSMDTFVRRKLWNFWKSSFEFEFEFQFLAISIKNV